MKKILKRKLSIASIDINNRNQIKNKKKRNKIYRELQIGF